MEYAEKRRGTNALAVSPHSLSDFLHFCFFRTVAHGSVHGSFHRFNGRFHNLTEASGTSIEADGSYHGICESFRGNFYCFHGSGHVLPRKRRPLKPPRKACSTSTKAATIPMVRTSVGASGYRSSLHHTLGNFHNLFPWKLPPAPPNFMEISTCCDLILWKDTSFKTNNVGDRPFGVLNH